MGEALLARYHKIEESYDYVNVGEFVTTSRAITDSRFIKCTGQSIYSTTYPELYGAIGDKFYKDSSSGLYRYDLPNYSSDEDSKYLRVSN